jgi:hypothetical protein
MPLLALILASVILSVPAARREARRARYRPRPSRVSFAMRHTALIPTLNFDHNLTHGWVAPFQSLDPKGEVRSSYRQQKYESAFRRLMRKSAEYDESVTPIQSGEHEGEDRRQCARQ